MAHVVDALIVGGGPAGLAAAIVLARAGRSVLLCEQRQFPVDKVCGEGIMPTGVGYLRRLGVEIETAAPLAGIRYYAPNGRVAEATFCEGPGLGVRRSALSAGLLAAVRQHGSLCLAPGAQVTRVSVTAGGPEALVNGQAVRTRLLIGADGLNSRVRRWAGLAGDGRGYWRWGTRQHFRMEPWSDHVEVYWSGRGLEAYVTPVSADQVGVAFLWQRGRYEALRGGRELFTSLQAAFPALRARLGQALPLSRAATIGPLQQVARRVVADGVLLIGDAAGYLDAITGEGLSLALAQALALERTVVPALASGSGLLPAATLAGYQSAYRAIVRPTYQVAGLALLLSRFPTLCNVSTGLFAADPGLFQQLLSANMGLRPVWRPWLALGLGRCLARLALQGAISDGRRQVSAQS